MWNVGIVGRASEVILLADVILDQGTMLWRTKKLKKQAATRPFAAYLAASCLLFGLFVIVAAFGLVGDHQAS